MAKSLAESKGLVPATALALPDELQQGSLEIVGRFSTPYVVFAQPAAKDQFKMLMQNFPDINDGDPCVIYPEPQKPERLQPFRCTLINAVQFWEKIRPNSNGTVESRHKTNAPGRVERIWCALLLYHKNDVIPVTCLAKTTKCPAFATLSKAIESASNPDFSKQSPQHEQAVAACPVPWARVVATITVSGKTSRSKGSNTYQASRAYIEPSGPNEWKLLATLGEEEKRKQLVEVGKTFQQFVSQLGLQ